MALPIKILKFVANAGENTACDSSTDAAKVVWIIHTFPGAYFFRPHTKDRAGGMKFEVLPNLLILLQPQHHV